MTLARLRVQTREPYEVVLGAGALAGAREVAGEGRCAVVSDENVAPLHARRLASLQAPLFTVEAGEGAKRFRWLERLLELLARSGLDRRSTLFALGGGSVGDLAGLAASLYMRGIAFVPCPTTLLAMVDASVGGKTAVDLAAGRNLAGTFHQPRAVLADLDTLGSLPERELRSGLGEAVKTALVAGEAHLARLEHEAERLSERETAALAALVARCVRVKAEIVARDEREAGERKVLNLGHTFAHALERAAGYGRVPHGEAVAVGLVLACRLSQRSDRLTDPSLPERLERLLGRLGLCTSLAALRERHEVDLDPEEVLAAMRLDKKGRAGQPAFVLPRAAGALELDVTVERSLVAGLLA